VNSPTIRRNRASGGRLNHCRTGEMASVRQRNRSVQSPLARISASAGLSDP